MKSINKKSLIQFAKVFLISMVVFELIEIGIHYFFDIDLHHLNLGWFGWLGFIVFYGFKYHILCCLLPALWAGYKCRHKDCDHDHCENE